MQIKTFITPTTSFGLVGQKIIVQLKGKDGKGGSWWELLHIAFQGKVTSVWKLSNDSDRERVKQKSFKGPGKTPSLRPREEDTVHILRVRPKQEGGKNTESPGKELEASFV